MGYAIAGRLRADGWSVIISARGGERLDQAAAAIGAQAVALDVSQRPAVAQAVAEVFARPLTPDTVILNAAGYKPMPLGEFDIDLFERLVQTNYLGVVYALGSLLPRLRERGGGQVLVTASVAGYRGLPLAAPYSATKAALINLVESLAPEAERQGVRLRLINPGFVRTELTAQNRFPMPFMLEADEAAQRVVRAIDDRRFEITFPRRLVYPLKLLRCLPYRLFFAVTRRMVARS